MRERVFIIDDDQGVLEFLHVVFRKAGYDVSTSRSGEEAIGLVRDETPDLIVCDVIMPGLNGFQVCRRLKEDEKTAAIPVILVSAKVDPADSFWAQETGALALFRKPINRRELLAKTESILRGEALTERLG